MKINKDDFPRTQAIEWFRALEQQLGVLFRLEIRTRLAMNSLEDEARKTLPRSSVTMHVKHRNGNPLPDAIHRVRLCGTPAMGESPAPARLPPRKRWYQHRKGPPSHDEMFFDAKDVGLLGLFNGMEDRKNCLNAARKTLVGGQGSIKARVRARADPRAWEAGDLSDPAPLLLSNDLPAASIQALGGAWRIFLRMAAVLVELFALAERHNAHPPYRGLRLAFRIDREHPQGRFIWTLHSQRLSTLARGLAKGKRPDRIDESSLPDRLLRKLRIPTAARKAISPHELHRRRLARIYGRYVGIQKGLLSAGPQRIEEARKLLRRAGLPESELTVPSFDSIPLAL